MYIILDNTVTRMFGISQTSYPII